MDRGGAEVLRMIVPRLKNCGQIEPHVAVRMFSAVS